MIYGEFEEILTEAIEQLPDEFARKLNNIEIVVEDHAPPEIQEKFGEDKLILGLYQGTPMTKRTHYYAGVLPDKISIYSRSLIRISRNREDLVERIKKTLLHEIGHYFGITDKELRELGY